MKIELNYFNDAGLEKNEIARAEAGKLFFAATGSDYKKDNSKFNAFLAEKLHSGYGKFRNRKYHAYW